jgi:hypothetical protein
MRYQVWLLRALPFLASAVFAVFAQTAMASLLISGTAAQINNATYTWVDMDTISGNFSGNTVQFSDPQGLDNYWDSITGNGGPAFTYGIQGTCSTNGSKITADPADPADTSRNVAYIAYAQAQVGTTGTPCIHAPARANISIGNSAAGSIMYTYSSNGSQLLRVDGKSQFTFNAAAGHPGVFTKTGNTNGCPDTIVVTNSSDVPGNATLYQLSPDNGKKPPASVYANSNCFINGNTDDVQSGSGEGPGHGGPFTIHVGGTPTSSSTGAGGGGGGGTSTPDNCHDTDSFAWVICPAITSLGLITDNIFTNAIVPLLSVYPISSEPGLQAVWAVFRSLADVFFVIIFLIIIFSTVISTGVDSYTIKKVLPRLVIAAILVQFSFFFSGFLIDVGNVLGSGIIDLVNNALAGATIPAMISQHAPAPANSILSGFVVGGGLIAIGGSIVWLAGPAVLFMLLALLISLVAFIVTLVVRLLLINVLVVLAPIAIVLWILPNTEKLSKKWLDNFIKVVLMFPMIALLLAAGRIIQAISFSGASNELLELVGMLGPLIAFALMPMTFKWAGTAMSSVSGVIGKRASSTASSVKGSQLAKDMKATSKGKRAAKYMDGSGTAVGKYMRGVALGGAGGMLGTAASKRRIAVLANTHEKGRMDEIKEQARDLSADQALQIIQGQDGKTVNGVKVDNYARRVMVDKLAEKRDTKKLETAKAHMGDELFASALNQSSNKSAVFEKARHLAGASYSGITADQLAKLDATGAEQMMRDLAGHQATLTTHRAGKAADTLTPDEEAKFDKAVEASQNLKNAIDGVASNANLRTQAAVGVGKAIHAGFDPAVMPTTETEVLATKASADAHIDATGKFS